MPFDPEQETLKFLKQRYAEASKRTVFFVGAGCSMEVGLPDWHSLAKSLFKKLNDSTPASALSGELLQGFHEAEELFAKKSYWDFFGKVEEYWKTLYEDFMSEEFSDYKLEKCDIPSVYKKIWKMRNVGQVLTLNIDGLLRRAYDNVFGYKRGQLLEFPGTSVVDSKSYFARNYPTILNLHGIYTQRSTWVMNAYERRRLFDGFGRGDYKSFLRHIFESYNVVFIGVNILDMAISPIIEGIANSGLLQDHYWVTPNISSHDFMWTQLKGVRVINYDPEKVGAGFNHSSVICSIIDDIESYKSYDRPVMLPRRSEASEDESSPSDVINVVAQDPMRVRGELDARIERIGQEHGFNGKQMSAFIKEYSVPLELSSVLGRNAPYNKLENLEITLSVSESNSSTVWMAKDTNSSNVYAIKALSGQAFKDRIERESFRRGIESLYHLNKANSLVAPKFLFHTNTPLAVAMEYIEGSSLAELQESSKELIRNNWHSAFLKICQAIMVCHTSDAEVLHRDIKPKNIILDGAYIGCDVSDFLEASIRFINFDMSWHKFSVGNTKSVSADEVGYYAPEQRNINNADTPRTIKTDVYMLGMTLLNILSDIPPPEGGAGIKDWPEYVEGKIKPKFNQDRLSASRVARLITKMTKNIPDERPDLVNSISELELIGYAMHNDWNNADPDLFVEKILTEIGYDYRWEEGALKGSIQTPRQIELSLGYLPRGQRIELRWMRQRDDGVDRKNFGGKLGELSSQVRLRLTELGWQVEDGGGHHSRSIQANIRIKDLLPEWRKSIEQISEVISRLMGDV